MFWSWSWRKRCKALVKFWGGEGGGTALHLSNPVYDVVPCSFQMGESSCKIPCCFRAKRVEKEVPSQSLQKPATLDGSSPGGSRAAKGYGYILYMYVAGRVVV